MNILNKIDDIESAYKQAKEMMEGEQKEINSWVDTEVAKLKLENREKSTEEKLSDPRFKEIMDEYAHKYSELWDKITKEADRI